MFGIGFGEVLIILVVVLLFVGPEKLPDTARAISKGIRAIRKQTTDIKTSLEQDEQIGGAFRDLRSAMRGDPLSENYESNVLAPTPGDTEQKALDDGKIDDALPETTSADTGSEGKTDSASNGKSPDDGDANDENKFAFALEPAEDSISRADKFDAAEAASDSETEANQPEGEAT